MSRNRNNRTRTSVAVVAGLYKSDTKRNLWEVAGFPETLDFDVFFMLFSRNGIGNAVVMKPVDKCWSTLPKIYDFNGEGEPVEAGSKFERELKVLIDDFKLFDTLYELDYMQRVGRYGGVVIVAKEKNETRDPTRPLVTMGLGSLVGFRPVFEGELQEGTLNDDFMSMDFGNPKTYNYQPNVLKTEGGSVGVSAQLDASRVYIFSENSTGNSVYGRSSLEVPYNAIHSATKVIVAGSEGLYKNAKQAIHVDVRDQNVADAMFNTDANKDKFDENMRDFAAGFDAELMTAGVDVKTLQSTLLDPTGAFNIALQEISAGSKIPKTELIGFETGERSSSENKSSWNVTCNSRRTNILNDMIKGFLKHLIKVKLLTPPTNGIHIVWDDLNEASDGEKLDLLSKMVAANLQHYQAGNSEPIFWNEEMRKIAGYEPIVYDDEFEGEEDGDDAKKTDR